MSVNAVRLVTTPTYGSLSGIDGNSFSYTRNSSTWTGTDTFTYKACDNHSNCSNVATVTINIVNQTPVAVNDTYNVHGYTQIGPMLANDYDPDGDPLTYSLLTNPSHGTLTVVSQADMPYYRPNSGYVGPDSFTYRVRDTFNSYSAAATVTINVNDLPPVANADYFIVHGSAIIGPMKGNDYDPEGDTIGDLSLMATPAGTKRRDYPQLQPNQQQCWAIACMYLLAPCRQAIGSLAIRYFPRY